MKTCTLCKKTKPLTAFSPAATRCKECRNRLDRRRSYARKFKEWHALISWPAPRNYQ